MTNTTIDTRDGTASRLTRARAAIEAGDYATADQLLRAVLAHHPSSVDGRYLLGLAHYRRGWFGEAVASFRALVESCPGDHRALYSLGVALQKDGDLVAARDAFSCCLAANPEFTEARQRLASLTAGQVGAVTSTAKAPDGAATLAARLEAQPAATPEDTLIDSGRRRLSSMAGRFVVAGLLVLVGAAMMVGATMASAPLARLTLLGRTPAFYRSRLAEVRDLELPVASIEADLNQAVDQLADRTVVIDRLLTTSGLALLVAACAVVVFAALAAAVTRYEIYTHRIDITRGVVHRQTDTIWLYEINDVVYERPWWLLASGNARIALTTDSGRHHIVGFGSAATARRHWNQIRDAALSERRAMRRWWI